MTEYVPDSQGMHNVAPGVDEYVLGGQGSHLSPAKHRVVTPVYQSQLPDRVHFLFLNYTTDSRTPLLTVPAGHGFMQPLAVIARFPSHVHDGTAANLPVLQVDTGTGPLGHTGWQIDPDGR